MPKSNKSTTNKSPISQSDRKKFWNNDMEAIIGIMLVLLILGTINVFSSSFIIAEADFDTPYFFLKRHIINIIIGLFAFGLCFKVDYHVWRKYIPVVMLVTILCLILVLIVGPSVNGARRWLPLGITQFQPAEMAKLVSIMLISAYLSVQVQKKRALDIITPQMIFIFIMFALTEQEPDMGTACIILGVPILMMVVVGLEKRKLLTMIGVVVAGATAAAIYAVNTFIDWIW